MRMARILSTAWLVGFFGYAVIAHDRLAGPAETHQLSRALARGFDAFGRDCWDLTVLAAFRSFQFLLPLALGLIALSIAVCCLRFLGNRHFEVLFRSALDTVTSFPGLLIALALGAFFRSSRSAFLLACAISLIPYLIRFYEGQVNEVRSRPYFMSTVALGAHPVHLYWYYVVPELGSSTLAVFPFLMTRLILIETSFSFLGIQAFSGGETWGRLLYQGKEYLLEAPWLLAESALPLFATLLAFHLLSDPERS